MIKHFCMIMFNVFGDEQLPAKGPLPVFGQFFCRRKHVLASLESSLPLQIGWGRNIQIFIPFRIMGPEINHQGLCEVGPQFGLCLQGFWQATEAKRKFRIACWE